MSKKEEKALAFERTLLWLHAAAPREIEWDDDRWPSLVHAVLASRFVEAYRRQSIRDADSPARAFYRACQMQRMRRSRVLPLVKVRLYQLREILRAWYEAGAPKIAKAAE